MCLGPKRHAECAPEPLTRKIHLTEIQALQLLRRPCQRICWNSPPSTRGPEPWRATRRLKGCEMFARHLELNMGCSIHTDPYRSIPTMPRIASAEPLDCPADLDVAHCVREARPPEAPSYPHPLLTYECVTRYLYFLFIVHIYTKCSLKEV